MPRLGRQVDALIAADRFEELRDLATAQLQSAPEDHWWLAILSSATYELRDYARALEIARQAEAILPNCPLVLWHLIGPLHMLGRRAEAYGVCRRLRDLLMGDPGEMSCHEDEAWNLALLADVRATMRKIRREEKGG